MNTIAVHKHHLDELLDDLSAYNVISGITFVALLNAYITRVDTENELTYGVNIDSKLRALLRAAQGSNTADQVKREDAIKSQSRSSNEERSETDKFRRKPKYLFHGTVK